MPDATTAGRSGLSPAAGRGTATSPIAIVGLACRFPDADDPAALLDVVLTGRRAFRRIPPSRVDLTEYYQPRLATLDATYSTRAALLEGWEFDRATFLVEPATYMAADPASWLAVETVARSLAAAGLPCGEGLDRDRTGVIIGNSMTGDVSRAQALRVRWPYVRRAITEALSISGIADDAAATVLRRAESNYLAPFPAMGPDSLAGAVPGSIAAAISSYFGFRGDSHVVDTGCSSSLQAVANACSALAAGDLDAAVAGGVDLSIDPLELIGLAKAGVLATTDVRIYDRHPTGFLPGEGCGMVLLMRSADAHAADLQVYAEILGWGSAAGGQPVAPGSLACTQLLAMRRAYERAAIDPAAIQYIEGNGAGTQADDEAELSALSSIRAGAKDKAALGSVKANIGHAKAAAGAAGLIKTVLALGTGVIPPATGAHQPHPLIADGDARVWLPDSAQEWESDVRLAAVGATGLGGGNVHVVLRHEQGGRARQDKWLRSVPRPPVRTEAEPEPVQLRLPVAAEPLPFLLHAPDRSALAAVLTRLAEIARFLSDAEMLDLASMLGRSAFIQGQCRVALVASRQEQLAALAREAVTVLPGLTSGPLTVRPGIFASESGSGRVTLLLSAASDTPDHVPSDEEAARTEAPEGPAEQAEPASGVRTLPGALRRSLDTLRWLESLDVQATGAVGHGLGVLTGLAWAGVLGESEVLDIADLRDQFLRRFAAKHAGTGDGRSGLDLDDAASRAEVAGNAELRATIAERFRFGPPRRRLLSTLTGEQITSVDDAIYLICGGFGGAERVTDAVRDGAAGATLLVETGPGRELTVAAGEVTDIPAISLADGYTEPMSAARAAAALFAAGAVGQPQLLFAGRPTRPIDIWRDRVFLTSPCQVLTQAQPDAQPDADAATDARPAISIPAQAAAEPDIGTSRLAEPSAASQPPASGPAADPAPGTAAPSSAPAPTPAPADADDVPDTAQPGGGAPAPDETSGDTAATPGTAPADTAAIPSAVSVGMTTTPPSPGPSDTGAADTGAADTGPAAHADLSARTTSAPEPADSDSAGAGFIRGGLAGLREQFERRLPARPRIAAATARAATASDIPHGGDGDPVALSAAEAAVKAPAAPAAADPWQAQVAAAASVSVPAAHTAEPVGGIGAWARCFVEELRPAKAPAAGPGESPWRVHSATRSETLAEVAGLFTADPTADRALAVIEDPADERSRAAAIQAARDAIATGQLVVLTTSPGLTGFFASLHAEYPNLGITVLRLPTDAAPGGLASVGQLAQAEPGVFRELVISATGLACEPVMTPLPLPGGGEFPLGSDDVMLVSRTTGGAALALAQVLAVTGAAIAVIGRAGDNDDSELVAGLEQLRAAGTRIGYEVIDTASQASLNAAVHRIEERLGPVTAIGHAAKHDGPVPFDGQDDAQVGDFVSQQVATLDRIVGSVRTRQLKLIITFGSVAGRYGLAGATAGALAAGALSGRAAQLGRTSAACRALHIDLPAWTNGGLGDHAKLASELAAVGTGALSVTDASRLLLKMLTTPDLPARLAVHGRVGGLATSPTAEVTGTELAAAGLAHGGRFLRAAFVHYPGVELVGEAQLSLASDPYLAEYRIDGMPVLPPALALEALAQAASVLAGRPLRHATEVELNSPVLIPAAGEAGVQVCALREGDTITTALRCSDSSYRVDHARAAFSCSAEAQQMPELVIGGSVLPSVPAQAGSQGDATARDAGQRGAAPRDGAARDAAQLPAGQLTGPAGLVDGAELYGPICFQSGRFRRIALLPEVTARSARSLARGGDEQPWFTPGSDLAETGFLLGSPGLNDAALQTLQAAVPHRRVRLSGCQSVQFAGVSADGPVEISAIAVGPAGPDETVAPARATGPAAVPARAAVPGQGAAPAAEQGPEQPGNGTSPAAGLSDTELAAIELAALSPGRKNRRVKLGPTRKGRLDADPSEQVADSHASDEAADGKRAAGNRAAPARPASKSAARATRTAEPLLAAPVADPSEPGRGPADTVAFPVSTAPGGAAASSPASAPAEQLWDVEVADTTGQPLAVWRGIRLRDAGPLPRNAAWPPSLLSVFVERSAIDLGLHHGLRVSVHCGQPDGPAPQPAAIVPQQPRRARASDPNAPAGTAANRPATMNVADAAGVGALAGFDLVASAPVQVSCGWAVVDRGHRQSQPIASLVPAYAQLRDVLDEPAALLAARLEAVGACLAAARIKAAEQLSVTRTTSDGWVAFETGQARVACVVAEISGVPVPVAIAVLTVTGPLPPRRSSAAATASKHPATRRETARTR
ncbi:MAG TPA: beta-ketoacyl synthase N-terminal-like domain-containing protein [Streptosporangiaceae bacterium]